MDIEKLTASIQVHEGTGPIRNGKFMPYPDKLGNQTIGWGHLISGGISLAAARQINSDDIQSAIGEAAAQDWWPCVSDNDARSRAMVELVFILGIPKLNRFTDALAALRRRDYSGAAAEILDSLLEHEDGQRIDRLAAMIKLGSDV